MIVGLAGFLYYYSSFNGFGLSLSKSAYGTVRLFAGSFVNNQYIRKREGTVPLLKTVNYHIFGGTACCTDNKLNHNLFRYENEFMADVKNGKEDAAKFFELPPVGTHA